MADGEDGATGAGERQVLDELARINKRLDAQDRAHDPAIISSRTANIIGLISLMVILLGIAGGSGAFLQSQQAEIVDRRLNEFHDEIDRLAETSRLDIDRQMAPLQSAIKLQVEDLTRRFDVLEKDLRTRYGQEDSERNVSVEIENQVAFYRGEDTNYCSGHLVLLLVNHTDFLTQLIETRYYSKEPLIFSNPANLTDWDDVETVGLANSDTKMLVGNDRRPYYLPIYVGRPQWQRFLDTWTPDRTYPVRFILSYLKSGNQTASYTLDRNVRIEQAIADCVRRKLAETNAAAP